MSKQPFTVSRNTMTDFECELSRLEQYATTTYILTDVLQDILNSEVLTQFEGETDSGCKIDLYNVFLALRDEAERIVLARSKLKSVFDRMYCENKEYSEYMDDRALKSLAPHGLIENTAQRM